MRKIDIAEKQKEIKLEKARLRKIFKVIYEYEDKETKIIKNRDNKNLIEELMERASFMSIILQECETEILDKGVIVEMQQGSYTITRENPAIKTYNATIKSYQNVISQLLGLIPEKTATLDEIGQEFLEGLK